MVGCEVERCLLLRSELHAVILDGGEQLRGPLDEQFVTEQRGKFIPSEHRRHLDGRCPPCLAAGLADGTCEE